MIKSVTSQFLLNTQLHLKLNDLYCHFLKSLPVATVSANHCKQNHCDVLSVNQKTPAARGTRAGDFRPVPFFLSGGKVVMSRCCVFSPAGTNGHIVSSESRPHPASLAAAS